jgi:hypothetical protein
LKETLEVESVTELELLTNNLTSKPKRIARKGSSLKDLEDQFTSAA